MRARFEQDYSQAFARAADGGDNAARCATVDDQVVRLLCRSRGRGQKQEESCSFHRSWFRL